MRVLYIVGGNGKGYGSEKVASDLINGLSNRGIDYVVITAKNGYINTICNSNGIENYVYPFYSYMYRDSNNKIVGWIKRRLQILFGFILDYIVIYMINKTVDLKSIDIIHTNLSRNFIGGLISKKYNIPHVWHIHELYSGHYNIRPLLKNQTNWMNKHADRFLVVSEAVGEGWNNAGLDRKKITTVYNGIHYNEIIQRKGLNHDHIKLVMVASISEAKGQHIIIKAISKLNVEDKNKIIIDFYGEYEEKEYYQYIRKLVKKFDINARFLGYKSDLYKRLGHYDIGVNCSKGEACCVSILEYKAAGLLSLVSSSGGNSELISNGVDGVLFDRYDIEFLSDKLKTIIDNAEMIESYGIKAIDSIMGKFRIETFLDNCLYQYELCEK